MALHEETEKGFVKWRYLNDYEGPGIIYAIRFTDGIVKIGKTTDMAGRKSWIKRLRRLGCDCDEISEGWMTTTQNVYWAEKAVHEFMNAIGAEIYQGREYYAVEFGTAVFAICYCLMSTGNNIDDMPVFMDIQNGYKVIPKDKVYDIIDHYSYLNEVV